MVHYRPRRRRSDGYNLVVLAMAVTVLNIMVAAALPAWSHLLQRYKEEELIFRGLQYAEAIRVFQQRHGRFPNKLDELIEVKPRCIRQLWTNPMTEDGSWLLIPANQPAPGRNLGGGVGPTDPQGRNPRQRPRPGVPGTTPRKELIVVPGESSRVTVQFIGVASPEGDDAIKTFNNSSSIADWQFRVELLKAGQVANPNSRNPGVPKPVNAGSFWKPFPPGVVLPQAGPGAAPGAPPKPPKKPQKVN
ncbi:MAG: hypothetical protein GY856_12720 [bacterium]|nr:hypothetical protein [bacterium]